MRSSGRITGYVIRELAGPTFLGLTVYTFFLLMNHFFLVAEKALSKNLGAEMTLRLFFLGVPELLVLSIPMSVLLGTLIAVGRLSADHEWVALQSAGRGPGTLLRPVLLHSLAWTLGAFFIYTAVVPQAHYALRNLTGRLLFASQLAADMKPRVFYDLPDNAVLFVDDIRADGEGRLDRVLLIQSVQGATQLILAHKADIYPAPDGDLALYVDFHDGRVHQYDEADGEVYRLVDHFEELTKRLPLAAYLQTLLAPPEKQVQDFTLGELTAEIGSAREARDELRATPDPGSASRLRIAERRLSVAKVEFQQRIALPLATLFFGMLALPLGIARVRSGKGAGFALSLLIIVLYRAAYLLARNQAVAGNVPAEVGPWAGNAIILAWALFAIWRMRAMPGADRGRIRAVLSAPFAALARRLAGRRARRTEPTDPEEPMGEASELTSLGGTPSRFVGRLDQYVGLAYLRVLLFAMTSAYLVYALVELQPLVDGALRTQQPLGLVLSYMKYLVPKALPLVLPISCLIGAVVAFTVLARTGELTAIKASGIGMRRATVPVLLLTTLLCGFLFLVQDHIVPAASRKAQTLKDRIEGRPARTYGVPAVGRWSFGPDGRRLYRYRVYDTDREEFRQISVFTLDRQAHRILEHRFAESARWTGSSWELEGGWFRTFPADGGQTYETMEGTHLAELDPPDHFGSKRLSLTSPRSDLPDQMSRRELLAQIADLRASGYDVTRLLVAYYGKYSNAMAPLVMVLLGLPFAFRVGRRGSLYGVGVALLLVLVYWAAFAIFNALGLETVVRPYVAAWAPNVLFGLLGVYLMLYIRT